MSKSEFLWVEKYRPQTIDECVLTKDLKDTFNGIVKSGELHNMLLSGTAGTGKTTVAKALCNELGLDWMLINGSEESGIDILRNKIKQFASTVSLTGGIKVIILDEADYLNAQSTQPALRGFIEEFSNNCRFILTCNFKNRLIEPLHSRCAVVEFNTNKKQLAGLASQFMGRLKSILDNEGVTYNEKVIAELIIRHAPDWRRVIGECQRYGSTGEIPAAILIGNSDESVAEVITHLKSKDFKSMRAWVANNAALDTSAIFRKIYDVLSDHADASGIPAAVLILADYQFKAAFVADKELNLVAAMTELMANVTWK
jgi:DNA polymerase III delta prime subunit